MGLKEVKNISNLMKAYDNVSSNKGWKTELTGEKFVESYEELEKLSRELGSGVYKPKPVGTIVIPKENGGKRRLGVPNRKDRIVQMGIKLVLEERFEGKFEDCSYGFRMGRSIHSLLKKLRYTIADSVWVIEGDISKCFDEINHRKLMELVKREVKDAGLISLLWKILRAGYYENGALFKPGKGVPQGSIIGPMMSNIYLDELDKYVMGIKKDLEEGTNKRRRSNPEYRKILWEDGDARRARRLGIPSRDPMDEKYIRVHYYRYADDFVVFVTGPRSLAVEIREDIRKFLSETLNLELSVEKTKIRNVVKEGTDFLGFRIKRCSTKGLPIIKGRRETIRPQIIMPLGKVIEKLKQKGFMDKTRNSPTRVGKLIHNTPEEIVSYYNWVYSGLANYYSCADNRSQLNRVCYVLRYSCALTLASKLRLRTKKKVFKKFGYELKVGEDVKYMGYKRKPRRFSVEVLDNWENRLSKKWVRRTHKLLGVKCAACGIDEGIEMHHVNPVRKMSVVFKANPLKKHELIRKRRLIPVCHKCHVNIHKGKYDGMSLKYL